MAPNLQPATSKLNTSRLPSGSGLPGTGLSSARQKDQEATAPPSVFVVVSWDDVNRCENIEGVYSTEAKANERIGVLRGRDNPHAMSAEAWEYGVDEDA